MIIIILLAVLSKLLIFAVEIGPKIFMPETDYGKYAYFCAQLVLLANVISFGGQNIILKEISSDKIYDGKPFYYSLLLSVIIFLATLLFYIALDASITVVFCGLMLSVILNNSTFYRCNGRIAEWYLLKDIVRSVVFFVLFLFGFYIYNDYTHYEMAVLCLTISLSLSAILASWHVRIPIRNFLIMDYNKAIKLLILISHRIKVSAPVIFVGFTYLALSRLDSFFIKEIIGFEALGDYSGISRIMYQSLFLQQVLMARELHKIAANFGSDINKAITMSNALRFKIVISTFFTAFFLCSLFNFEFFLNILNFNYADAFIVSVIFAVGHISVGIFGLYGYLLLYANKQYYEYFNCILIIVFAAGMHYFFIPVYGLIGAAIATSLAIVLGNILEFYQFRYLVLPNLKRRLINA